MKTVKDAKREGRRVTVSLDGDGAPEKLRLTAALWDSLGIAAGSALAPEDEKRLRAASSLSETVTDAARIVADAPVSVSGLVTKLVRRGHTKEDAIRAASALVRSGALDEAENARHVARSVFSRTRRGPARITADLLAKGFPRAAAGDAASSITEEEYDGALRRHIESRRPGESDEKFVASLVRLGFSAHKIKEFLK